MKTNQRTATAESTEEETKEGCSECGGDVHKEGTEIVCDECGLVVDEDVIDHGPEWRAFDQRESEAKSRVGAPVTASMHDKGMSTMVGGKTDTLDEKTRRLRKWQKRTVMGDGKERGLQDMMGEIWRLVSELGLPEFVEEGAANIVRKASEEDLVKGRSYETVAASAVLIASRTSDNAVSIHELVELVNLGEDTQIRIQRTYRKIKKGLELKVEPPQPSNYINPPLEELRYQIQQNDNYQQFRKCVENVVDDAVSNKLHSGADPRSIAAAAVYVVARKRDLAETVLTQNDVGDAYGVSNATLRDKYQKIEGVRSGE